MTNKKERLAILSVALRIAACDLKNDKGLWDYLYQYQSQNKLSTANTERKGVKLYQLLKKIGMPLLND